MIRWRRGDLPPVRRRLRKRNIPGMRASCGLRASRRAQRGRVAFRNRFPRRAAHSFSRERRCCEDGLCPRRVTVRGVGIRCKAGFCAGGTRERRGRQATLGGADARGRTAARRTAKRHGSGWRTTGFQGAGRLAMGAWTVARLAEASIRQGGCNFASRDGVAGRMRQSRHAICAAPSHRGTSQLRPLSLRDALY